MSRLYLRFYFALLGSLVVFAVTAALIWHRVGGPVDRAGAAIGQLVQNALPPLDATPAEVQARLQQLSRHLGSDVSLLAHDRSVVASIGQHQPMHGELHAARDWLHPWKRRATWTTRLPDGRWLVVALPAGFARPGYALLLTLVVLAVAVAVGAFPIVRRLAQRLERLQRGVECWGAGDLASRVAVEGRDEVARLATSFNHAAARIETLVDAHRSVLANASHELRTPLARIRLAVELLKDKADPRQKAGLESDIVELDRLIDEILLASRLDAGRELDAEEDVDLLALAAEECARYPDVQLDGQPCSVRGVPHLLRRLLRNLLENAQRHGSPPVHVELALQPQRIAIRVADDGPGVPEEQRERIFEPFFRRSGSREGGAGLGLALVRQIARRHGGEARCEAGEGGRSCFVVELPRGEVAR